MQCAKLRALFVIAQSSGDVWWSLHGDFEACNRSEAGGEGNLICLRFPAASPFGRLSFKTKASPPDLATPGASCTILSSRCWHLSRYTYA